MNKYYVCPLCNGVFVKKNIKKIEGKAFCPNPKCDDGIELILSDEPMVEIVKILNQKDYMVTKAWYGDIQCDNFCGIGFYNKESMPKNLPEGWSKCINEGLEIYQIILDSPCENSLRENQRNNFLKLAEMIDWCENKLPYNNI